MASSSLSLLELLESDVGDHIRYRLTPAEVRNLRLVSPELAAALIQTFKLKIFDPQQLQEIAKRNPNILKSIKRMLITGTYHEKFQHVCLTRLLEHGHDYKQYMSLGSAELSAKLNDSLDLGFFGLLTGLTELHCYDRHITNGCFDKLTNLTFLDCASSPNLSNGCFDSLINLRTLKCGGCPLLTDGCFDTLQNLTSLECRCCKLTNRAFETLVNLTEFDCSNNAEITNGVFDKMTNLTDLKCARCPQLTNGVFDKLIKLDELNCDGCAQLTNGCFDQLTRLNHIYCFNCPGLQDGCFDAIPHKLLTIESAGSEHLSEGYVNARKQA